MVDPEIKLPMAAATSCASEVFHDIRAKPASKNKLKRILDASNAYLRGEKEYIYKDHKKPIIVSHIQTISHEAAKFGWERLGQSLQVNGDRFKAASWEQSTSHISHLANVFDHLGKGLTAAVQGQKSITRDHCERSVWSAFNAKIVRHGKMPEWDHTSASFQDLFETLLAEVKSNQKTLSGERSQRPITDLLSNQDVIELPNDFFREEISRQKQLKRLRRQLSELQKYRDLWPEIAGTIHESPSQRIIENETQESILSNLLGMIFPIADNDTLKSRINPRAFTENANHTSLRIIGNAINKTIEKYQRELGLLGGANSPTRN